MFDDLEAPIQQEILTSSYLKTITSSASAYLNGIKVTLLNSRLVGDLKLQAFTNECEGKDPIYLTSLIPSSKCELPDEVKALASFITLMLNTENDEVLKATVLENGALISALRFEKVMAQVSALNTPIAREKILALNVLRDIQMNFISTLTQSIETGVSSENFSKLKPFLNKL